MMGLAGLYTPENMARMAAKVKADMDANAAKVNAPCEITRGEHQWIFTLGSWTGLPYYRCNCGAHKSMQQAPANEAAA